MSPRPYISVERRGLLLGMVQGVVFWEISGADSEEDPSVPIPVSILSGMSSVDFYVVGGWTTLDSYYSREPSGQRCSA